MTGFLVRAAVPTVQGPYSLRSPAPPLLGRHCGSEELYWLAAVSCVESYARQGKSRSSSSNAERRIEKENKKEGSKNRESRLKKKKKKEKRQKKTASIRGEAKKGARNRDNNNNKNTTPREIGK